MYSKAIAAFAMFLCSAMAYAADEPAPLRFGLTPAIVHDQRALMAELRGYFEKKLQRPVEFISRDSYRDTIELLKHRKMDFAWVSDYPYVYMNHVHFVKLLAMPVYHGRPYYCAYLIVPDSDRKTASLRDLKGKIFAYADPYSNSGYLVPRYQIRQMNLQPASFFQRTFFTWSHKKVIEAVGQGLADGAYVDSFVWDSLALIHPEMTRRTRVVAKSPEYGFPPIVAQYSQPKADFEAMQKLLLGMRGDPEGAKLLKQLNIDGFVTPDPKLYLEVEMMMLAVGDE